MFIYCNEFHKTHTQTHTYTDAHIHRCTHTDTHTHRSRHTHTQTDRQTYRHRQTDTHTHTLAHSGIYLPPDTFRLASFCMAKSIVFLELSESVLELDVAIPLLEEWPIPCALFFFVDDALRSS